MISRMTAALAVIAFLIVSPARAQQAPAGASRWPVQVSTDHGTVTIFQPQLEDFQGNQLSGRAAVSIQAAGQAEPTYGAIWIQSRVSIDRVARTVQILDVNITKSRFPEAAQTDQDSLTAAVKQVFTGHVVSLSLDQLLSMLEVVHKEQAAATQLQSTPPKIIFLDHPAVKVQYDGQPRLMQVDNSNLLRADNTPFFVVLDPASKTYFLKGGGQWFAASDPMGPFHDTTEVPAVVSALADASGYKDPQQALSATQAAAVEIVTATDPTELIWTDGPPEMSTIAGTDLLYVTNTDSDVFMLIGTSQLYVLLSGRWYTATNHDGPWTYVPPGQLPADFGRIPPDSDKADVLADVPGTQAARDAVADTYLPQTTAIARDQVDEPPVEYDGDPDFEPIEGTDMTWAVNTDASVIQVGGRYYCCYDGVWYLSDDAQGPWQICTAVPAEIYTIPPSCPLYPCRFVYCYGYTPDVVYCGYLPGYVGCYADDGVVVYGTGWYYHPWLRHHYYPRPWTFGFAPRYNWYSGHWGFDFAIGFGGGRGWIGARPGRFVRSGGNWFGFGGFRPVYAHDAAHLTAAQRELTIDASRRDAYLRSVYDHRGDLRKEPGIRDIALPERPANVKPAANDVFADHDGNVFRRTMDGWQTRQQNQWHDAPAQHEPAPARPVQTPREEPGIVRSAPEPARPNYGDLNNDYRARVDGDQRVRMDPMPTAPARGGGGFSGGGGGGARGGGGGRR
jgi:hypothetical protein